MHVSEKQLKETFQNNRVVVTGASQGIGRELVKELAKHGAHVVMASRSVSKLEAVKNETLILFPHARLDVLPADLSSKTECIRMIKEAIDLLGGGMDTIILNHVASSVETWVVEDEIDQGIQNRDYVEDMFHTNTFSYIWLATEAMSSLAKSGGRIGVISSLAGHVGSPKVSLYSASKHALHGFFNALRLDLQLIGLNGISITICSIGATETEGATRFKHHFSSWLSWDPPEWAAQSILKGLAVRQREIFHPHHMVFPTTILSMFVPAFIDRILLAAQA